MTLSWGITISDHLRPCTLPSLLHENGPHWHCTAFMPAFREGNVPINEMSKELAITRLAATHHLPANTVLVQKLHLGLPRRTREKTECFMIKEVLQNLFKMPTEMKHSWTWHTIPCITSSTINSPHLIMPQSSTPPLVWLAPNRVQLLWPTLNH